MHSILRYILLTILSLNILVVGQFTWPKEYAIGVLSNNLPDEFYYLIVNQSLSDLKDENVLPNDVEFKVRRYFACDELSSVNASLQLWNKYNVSIVFGPECSEGMVVVAYIAASYNKPIMGYRSISGALANVTRYPTLIRTSFGTAYFAMAIGTLLNYYSWNKITIIQNADNCDVALSNVVAEFRNRNITIVNNIYIDFSSPSSIENALLIMKMTSRIVLLCNGFNPISVYNFLLAVDKAGLNTPDYAYITPYFFRESYTPWQPWMWDNVTNQEAARARSAYKNTILIQGRDQTGVAFSELFARLSETVNANPTQYSTKFLLDYMIHAAVLRDSIYVYGTVLNKSISNGIDVTDGVKFFNAAIGTTILNGATSKILIDNLGRRVPSYDVLKLNQSGFHQPFMKIADLTLADSTYTLSVDPASLSQPMWNTNSGLPPPVVPLCGFQDELCQKDIILQLAIGLPIGVLILIFLIIIGVYLYRKYDFEQQLLAMNWRIDLSQFHYNKLQIQGTVSSGSAANEEQIEVDRVTNFSGSHGTSTSANKYDNTGVYKSNTVSVKKWQRVGRFTMTRDFLLRLKQIKEMNHDNINKFVGFSADAENAVISLWEFCAKRSLQDIVFNEDVHLDVTFQGSILRDIIYGLEYLHMSPIGYHGKLFISNCVVDSRWIVKLTDFGLQPIINYMTMERIILVDQEIAMDMNKLICTAPEVLRFPTYNDLKPADIYQFGMIMYQLLFREPPFADSHLTSQEIVISLKRETANSVVLRPGLKQAEGLGANVQGLMVNCWREDAAARPSIVELKKEIFSSTKQFGKNLLDHVMSMLEKYATNLEKIVDERTVQLNEERNRADRLLYQLLPRTVADSLKTGNVVHPESFDCVTIYFSDIVGFTALCSKSKPVQIVQMLNDLYSQFDALILKGDAFKVETIGDAYLVVSGLPTRNGTKHVTVMADLSLEILKVLSKYKVPHLPDASMKLRIGIHSGPVAAGVVGLTMPKYCLFGDSVNFASRMESTGEDAFSEKIDPQLAGVISGLTTCLISLKSVFLADFNAGRIHITEFTKKMLDKYPEYVTDLRGEIEVKGKGLCTTYWLVDKVK